MITYGNKELMNGRLAAVLNSSQSKTPCGNDDWIVGTIAAIGELASQGYTILTSIGLLTWELAIYLVHISQGKQIIICPGSGDGDSDQIYQKLLDDFDLDRMRTAIAFLKSSGKDRSPKDSWHYRDEAIIALANEIFPVSIRREGRLEKLLANCDPAKINNRYKMDFVKSKYRRPRYDLNTAENIFPGNDYITHWTRTFHGPWPGEKAFEFYAKLTNSGDSYPNSAFETLKRILCEKRLRASSQKIREARKVIGFSEGSPNSIVGLIRWCPRQVNWNFEPYGIAIKIDAAKRLGIRPVIYGSDNSYANLSESDKPYFQNKGGPNINWSREQEWRHAGDLDLGLLEKDEATIIVWQKHEAEEIKTLSNFRVFHLSN